MRGPLQLHWYDYTDILYGIPTAVWIGAAVLMVLGVWGLSYLFRE